MAIRKSDLMRIRRRDRDIPETEGSGEPAFAPYDQEGSRPADPATSIITEPAQADGAPTDPVQRDGSPTEAGHATGAPVEPAQTDGAPTDQEVSAPGRSGVHSPGPEAFRSPPSAGHGPPRGGGASERQRNHPRLPPSTGTCRAT